jgi:hypothetical protein
MKLTPRTWQLINYGLAALALALVVGIVLELIERANITGAQWPIFAAGIVVFVVLATLAAVFGPRYRNRV